MKLSDLLKNYRKENNLSARAFARKVGVSNSYISLIEKDSTKSPTLDVMAKIARAMNIDTNELIDMLEDTEITVKAKPALQKIQLPLYGPISCGNGAFVDDNVIEYVAFPSTMLSPRKEYFAQYASGDSMIDENIYDGDLVVFEKTNQINNGEIGCFCIDDNVATCKKYYNTNSNIILQPANQNYAPIVVDFAEGMNFRILGRLVLVVNNRDLRR